MHTITKFALWTAALLVVSAPQLASSAECNDAHFHCTGDKTYQLCLDGSLIPNTDVMECPTDTMCSSGCYDHCLPAASIPCKSCNKYKFVCETETSFKMCIEEFKPPYDDIYTCDDGTVCSDFCSTECSAKKCNPVICTINGEKLPSREDPKTYYLCTNMSDNTFTVKEFTCPGTTIFDKTSKACVRQPTTITTTPKPQITCDEKGRFPDPAGVTGYYVCADDGTGVKSIYVACPNGTTFNSAILKCSFGSNIISTQRPPATPEAEINCTSTGKFADATSCNKYILCTSTDGVNFEATTYTCPSSSFYNPETSRCTNTPPSSCPVVSRSALSSTEFKCPGVGRFEDPNSCYHYHLCVADEEEDGFFKTNSYKSFSFPCPDSSSYNPETQQCTYLDNPCMK